MDCLEDECGQCSVDDDVVDGPGVLGPQQTCTTQRPANTDDGDEAEDYLRERPEVHVSPLPLLVEVEFVQRTRCHR